MECQGDKVPKMGVWGQLQKHNIFSYSTSSFNSTLVHIHLDYMICVHGGPIYLNTQMTRRPAVLSVVSYV